jgi:SAM-dependent methyltransferase
MSQSLPPAYFDGVYAANPDPWQFATSSYERDKYAVTLAALPQPSAQATYQRAFEVGCSIGVLTAQLATRCDAVLAVDVNDSALSQARARCAALPQVEFARMQVPTELPEGSFDLIVVSEVGYYWSHDDLARAAGWMLQALRPGGALVLVHWTPVVQDYPLTGDDVHAHFLALADDGALRHLHGARYAQYRVDVFAAA